MSAECIRDLIINDPAYKALYDAGGSQDAALLTLLNDPSRESEIAQSTYPAEGGALRPGHVTNQSMVHDFRIIYADDPAGAEVKAGEVTGDFNAKLEQVIRTYTPPADEGNPTDPEKAAARDYANTKSFKARIDAERGLNFADPAIQNWLVNLFGLTNPYLQLGFYDISPAQKHCRVDATQADIDEARRIDGTTNVGNRCAAADDAAREARLQGQTYQQIVDAGAAAYNGYSGGP